MKTQIKWTTEKGSEVEIKLVTEKTESYFNDGDRTEKTKKCWELITSVNTLNYTFEGSEIVSHEKAGICLKVHYCQTGYIPIPSDVLEDVKALVNKYTAEKNRQQEITDKAVQAEKNELAKKIKNGYCPKCGSYCCGDCESN